MPAAAAAAAPQGHAMGGMSHSEMMAHCAQMQQQPRAGMSPDMQRMMTSCDQMGAQSGRR